MSVSWRIKVNLSVESEVFDGCNTTSSQSSRPIDISLRSLQYPPRIKHNGTFSSSQVFTCNFMLYIIFSKYYHLNRFGSLGAVMSLLISFSSSRNLASVSSYQVPVCPALICSHAKFEPFVSFCLFLLIFSVTKTIYQLGLMLSYHLFFNQISIIARLNIGDEEAGLNSTDPKLWCSN